MKSHFNSAAADIWDLRKNKVTDYYDYRKIYKPNKANNLYLYNLKDSGTSSDSYTKRHRGFGGVEYTTTSTFTPAESAARTRATAIVNAACAEAMQEARQPRSFFQRLFPVRAKEDTGCGGPR